MWNVKRKFFADAGKITVRMIVFIYRKKHHKKTNKLVFIHEIVIFVADIIIYVRIESNLKYCKKYNNLLDFNVLFNGSCFSILIPHKKYFRNLSEKCPGFTAAFCCGVYSNLTAFENPRERREIC